MRGLLTLRLVFAVFFVFTVTFFIYGSYKAGAVSFHQMMFVDGVDGMVDGLIFTIPVALTQLTAPATNYILTLVPTRIVATVGVALSGTGYLLMGAVASNGSQFLLFSIISGVGFGFLRYISVIHLHEVAGPLFPILRSVGNLGGFAGITLLPFFINAFLEKYGLPGAFCSYGILCFTMLPFSILIPKQSLGREKGESEESGLASRYSEEELEGSISNVGDHCSPGESPRHSLLMTSGSAGDRRHTCTPLTPFTGHDDEKRRRCLTAEINRDGHKLARHERRTESLSKLLQGFLFILAAGLRRFPSGTWALFLIPFVQELGLTTEGGILAASISGVGGIFGALLAIASFGVLDSKGSLLLLALYFLIMAPVFLAFNWMSEVWVQFVLPFLSGTLVAACSGMVPGILSQIATQDTFGGLYALMEITAGIFFVMSGPLGGFGYNTTGSFGAVFKLNAILSGLCALLMGVVVSLEQNPRSESEVEG